MNPKKQIIITSLICGLISLILLFFVIYPLIKGIKYNSESIVNLKKEVKFLQSQEKNLAELKDLTSEVEPDFVKMNNLLIDPEVPIDLIKFLEKTAEEQNVSIEIAAPSLKREEKGLWNYMNFQINIQGSFSNVLRFVEKIESSPFLIETISLSISRLDKIGKDKKILDAVTANFSIKVFTK